MIAAFADLHVADVRQVAGVESHSGVQLLARLAQQSALVELRNEPLHLGGAEEEIDLGERVDQLLLVALDHAADGDDRLAAALRLESRGLDHRVDRLLLGGVDEAAGVDDDHFGVGEIRGVLGGIVGELREIPLAVDGVLVAAECDDADFHAVARWGTAAITRSVNGSSRT